MIIFHIRFINSILLQTPSTGHALNLDMCHFYRRFPPLPFATSRCHACHSFILFSKYVTAGLNYLKTYPRRVVDNQQDVTKLNLTSNDDDKEANYAQDSLIARYVCFLGFLMNPQRLLSLHTYRSHVFFGTL